MGGLTSWTNGRNVSPFRSLLISLAGPVVGLVVGALLILFGGFALPTLAPNYHALELATRLFDSAVAVNIIWSLFKSRAGDAARWRQRVPLLLGAHEAR